MVWILFGYCYTIGNGICNESLLFVVVVGWSGVCLFFGGFGDGVVFFKMKIK